MHVQCEDRDNLTSIWTSCDSVSVTPRTAEPLLGPSDEPVEPYGATRRDDDRGTDRDQLETKFVEGRPDLVEERILVVEPVTGSSSLDLDDVSRGEQPVGYCDARNS